MNWIRAVVSLYHPFIISMMHLYFDVTSCLQLTEINVTL